MHGSQNRELALGLCTEDEVDNPSLTIQSTMHGLCANYARMPTWERPLGRAQTTTRKVCIIDEQICDFFQWYYARTARNTMHGLVGQ